MDDLIADFVAECREMLEALGGEIVAWEANPDDRARLDSIFRFVHTVKGNCGFFDFPRLEALSHAAEDALADCRSGRRTPDGALVSAVLAIIDRIGEMIAAIDAGEELPSGDDSSLIEALAPGAEGTATQAAVAVVADNKGNSSTPRTIRLSVELLDRVMSGVSDMVLARNELARRLREAPGEVEVDGAFERLSGIIAEMRDAITRTRMQRIENLFVALPRMVRDLSSELGKQVLVDIDGGDVELDREMIEMIRDPLTHIIRNAVDHGFESPADRLKAGKREIGLLSVSARQSGNQILIEIADDGNAARARRVEHELYGNWSFLQLTQRRRRNRSHGFRTGRGTVDDQRSRRRDDVTAVRWQRTANQKPCERRGQCIPNRRWQRHQKPTPALRSTRATRRGRPTSRASRSGPPTRRRSRCASRRQAGGAGVSAAIRTLIGERDPRRSLGSLS